MLQQHFFLFQFILTVEGRGGKFNLKNTILNIGSGNFDFQLTFVIKCIKSSEIGFSHE